MNKSNVINYNQYSAKSSAEAPDKATILKPTPKNQLAFHEEPYRFVSLEDIYEQTTEVEWLVENYIPKRSIGMLYGPSSVGKTHVVLGMAAKITTGGSWCENDVEQGLVLFMAGEGHTGFKRRLLAIEEWHELSIDRNNLRFSERAISIDSDEGIKEIIGAIEALDRAPSLIIIDTLSRHLMSSSENDNAEMARVINRLEVVKKRFDCSIMIIHHTGKNEKSGPRGATSLFANIDFMFSLLPCIMQPKVLELECEKQKDASDKIMQSFQIIPVVFEELDSKGQPIVGACATPSESVGIDEARTLDNIALESFAPDKADWLGNFIVLYDEIIKKDIQLDSKKKCFRTIVHHLVEAGDVIQHSKTEFELAPMEDGEE